MEDIEQSDNNAASHLDLNEPNITVIVEPTGFDKPCKTSIEHINEVAENRLKAFDVSTAAGGIYAVTPTHNRLTGEPIKQTECWEINECGRVYYRRIWPKRTERNYEYLLSLNLMKYIVESMKTARSVYQTCGYIENIEIRAYLQQVFGEHLAYTQDDDKQEIEQQECKSPHISVHEACRAEQLVDREHLISIVDSIVFPFIRAFDGIIKQRRNDPARRDRIARIVDGRS